MATSGSISTNEVTGGKLTFSWSRTNSGSTATINWKMTLTGTRDGTTTSNAHSVTVSATSGSVSSASLNVGSMTVNVVNGVTATTYKSGSFTLTRNSSGNGGFKISFSTYINGNSVSASQSWTLDSVTVYSKCGAPSSVTLSPSYVAPSGTITISWSGASSGTNNSISSYQIYYYVTSGGTAPSTSTYTGTKNVTSTSTSGSTTITLSSTTRGYKIVAGVVTRGSAGSSYYSSIKTSSAITVNSLPAAPSGTGSTTILSTNSTGYHPSITAGTDTNGQTCSVYYATSSGGTKAAYTSSVYIKPSAGATSTYYFWTYDNVEYSSSYITYTVTKNAKPGKPTVTFTPATLPNAGGNITYTITPVDTDITKIFYSTATTIATTGSSIAASGKTAKTLARNSMTSSSSVFNFWAWDGLEFSDMVATVKPTFNTKPGTPTVTASPTKVKAAGDKVTFSITPASSDNTRIYWNTSNTINTNNYMAASGTAKVTKELTVASGSNTVYFWGYDGYDYSTSASYVTVTINAAPASPTVSPASVVIKPSTSTNITITTPAASSGETNTLYYSTTATGTKTKFTSPLSMTAPATRNNTLIYYFYTYDGYDYSSSKTATVKANNLPSTPTISAVSPTIVVPGGNVNFTITTGSDSDNQQYSVYYATTSGGTKTLITSGANVKAPTTRGNATYYFWTYDGLEYSSTYITKGFKVNTLPPAPTGTTSTIISSTSTGYKPTITAGNDSDGQTLTVYYSTSKTGSKALWGSGVYINPSAGNSLTYYFWNYDTLEYNATPLEVTVKKNALPQLSITATGVTSYGGINYTKNSGGNVTFTFKGTNTNYNNIIKYQYKLSTSNAWTDISTSALTTSATVTIPARTTSVTNQIYNFRAYDGLEYSSQIDYTIYMNALPNVPVFTSASIYESQSTSSQFTFRLTPGNLNNTQQQNANLGKVYYSTTTAGTKTVCSSDTNGYYYTTSRGNSNPKTIYFWTWDGFDYSDNYVTGQVKIPGTPTVTISATTPSYSALGTNSPTGGLSWGHNFSGTISNTIARTATVHPVLKWATTSNAPTWNSINLSDFTISSNGSINQNYNIAERITSGTLNFNNVYWYLEFTPSATYDDGVKIGTTARYPENGCYVIPRAPSLIVGTDITNETYTTNISNTFTNNTLVFWDVLYIQFQPEGTNGFTNLNYSIKIIQGTKENTFSGTNIGYDSSGRFSLSINAFANNWSSFDKTMDSTIILSLSLNYGNVSKQMTITGTLLKIKNLPDANSRYWRFNRWNNYNPYSSNPENCNLLVSDITGSSDNTPWSTIQSNLIDKYYLNAYDIFIYKNDLNDGKTLMNLLNASAVSDTTSTGIYVYASATAAASDTYISGSESDITYGGKIRIQFNQADLFDFTRFTTSSGYMGLTPSNIYAEQYPYNIGWRIRDVFGQETIKVYSADRTDPIRFLPADTKTLNMKVYYNTISNPSNYNSTPYDPTDSSSSNKLQPNQYLKINGELTHQVAIKPASLKFTLNKSSTSTPIESEINSLALTGSTTRTGVKTDLCYTKSSILVNQTGLTQVTYTLSGSTGVSATNVACLVAPQYAPSNFNINALTIIRDTESTDERYKLKISYTISYAGATTAPSISPNQIEVYRSPTEIRPTSETWPTDGILANNGFLSTSETTAEKLLIDKFQDSTSSSYYNVKEINYIYLKVNTTTAGLYSSDNIISYYTPIRIGFLQTPTMALRKNKLGINVSDDELFNLSATTDTSNFLVAKQLYSNDRIITLDAASTQLISYNPTSQVIELYSRTNSVSTDWTQVRFIDLINGIVK